MKFGPRRGHVIFIFERFFRDFGLLLAALVVALILRDYQNLLENIPVMVIVLFAPVKRLADFLFTFYSVDDERLLVESGWLNKKRQEIPLSNITTVDFTQNLFFQLAKVYSVHVDNASSIGSGVSGKVTMALKVDDAIQVKGLLLSKQDSAKQEQQDDRISEDTGGNTILASAGEILLMGLLKSKAAIVFQLLAYAGAAISLFSKLFFEKNVDGEEMMVKYALGVSAPLIIAFLLLALYLLGVAVSVGLCLLKYYGFRVTDREESIFVEYGLLTKKTHTLMKEKISGASYRQSILMRAFGRGTLEVFAIGYGETGDDNGKEVAVLYPVLRREKLHAFLERFLPEVSAREEYARAERKAVPYFFICPRFILALAVLTACLTARLMDWPWEPLVTDCIAAAGLLIFAAAVVSVILEYCNTGIFGNRRLISLTCGSYTKETVFIKTEKVESIEERATTRKKNRKHITTIRLGILAPSRVARQRVRNIAIKTFKQIKDKLVY